MSGSTRWRRGLAHLHGAELLLPPIGRRRLKLTGVTAALPTTSYYGARPPLSVSLPLEQKEKATMTPCSVRPPTLQAELTAATVSSLRWRGRPRNTESWAAPASSSSGRCASVASTTMEAGASMVQRGSARRSLTAYLPRRPQDPRREGGGA
jgi:hypothetical protein